MARLNILGAGPVKRGITQIAAAFAKASGHQADVEFTGAPRWRQRASTDLISTGIPWPI
jgi:accessory colonization factor AcfC